MEITNSKQLAKLIGPTICVVTVSEMINYDIWATNNPQIIYLNGVFLFIAGISILLKHNHWTMNWSIMITLVGWLCIIGGLFRTFFPEAKQAEKGMTTFVMISLLLAVGIFLTFKGYRRNP